MTARKNTSEAPEALEAVLTEDELKAAAQGEAPAAEAEPAGETQDENLSLIHISEPTRH